MAATARAMPLAAPLPSRPAPAPEPRSAPRLRLVRPPAHTRTRVPFVSLCMAVLAVALIASLLLNTTMAQDSHRVHDLQLELASLARSVGEAEAALDAAASPEQLAKAARRLGMVPAPEIAFVQLADQRVLGNPKPAKADQ